MTQPLRRQPLDPDRTTGFVCGPESAFIPLLRRDGMSPGDVDRTFATFNVTQFNAERLAE